MLFKKKKKNQSSYWLVGCIAALPPHLDLIYSPSVSWQKNWAIKCAVPHEADELKPQQSAPAAVPVRLSDS